MHRCPNRACPSRGLETLINWVMAATDIEGVGEQFVRRLWELGLAALAARPLPADHGAAARARGLRRDLRDATRSTRSRASKDDAVLARALRAEHPRRRLGDGAERSRATSARSSALDASQEEIVGGRRHRAGARRGDRRVVRGRGQPGARRRAAARPLLDVRTRRPARRAADRQHVRDHRHAGVASRAKRPARRSRRSAPRCPDSVSKKTTGLIVGEEPGASKVRGAEKHGTAVLDEAALKQLLGREN